MTEIRQFFVTVYNINKAVRKPSTQSSSFSTLRGLFFMRLASSTEVGQWKVIADNIDHEAWLVHGLEPDTEYQFRLLAMNKIGWSMPGFPTLATSTKTRGECPKQTRTWCVPSNCDRRFDVRRG